MLVTTFSMTQGDFWAGGYLSWGCRSVSMPSQSEAKAQNVARGHKAAISNPNVSEEAKEHSRQVLEDIEGTSDRDAFVASTGTEKHSNYDSDRAAKTAGDVHGLNV
ncbi:Conidiation protein 6-domain-containing protein [Dichomitus squalens]|uniref:Conidiation protein 6-domain-containing protein n=1 Tax=Dichomitus squalens TaxID=114155 RepID=A0A4Q9Q4M0_9APHY|nr:Conidiation protein 6-domain-containing protein [Dichomitus squalens]